MHTMVQAAYTCAVTGAMFLMEHPAASACPLISSCWRLPEVVGLRQLRGRGRCRDVAFHTFDQCTCLAPSRKATTLLAVNAEHLADLLYALPGHGKCFHNRHELVLTGLTEEGVFRTSAAKQYPSRMCMVLAETFFRGMPAGVCPAPGSPEPRDELSKFFMPLDPYFENHGWGNFAPDLARGR